jgi:hypothetical protein
MSTDRVYNKIEVYYSAESSGGTVYQSKVYASSTGLDYCMQSLGLLLSVLILCVPLPLN